MIEERRGTKEERLYLLHEIAEEAGRLKYGGDDKIRVACTAADTLKAHSAHIYTLAERMPEFDVALLRRRTAYPHVSDKSFMPLNMDTGRRRRGGAGSSGLLGGAGAVDPSPAKRKRVVRDEEIDIGGVRSPHKRERLLGEGVNPRSRLGRGKKNERAPSPSESLVSVTSHLPSQNAHHANGTSSTRGGASSAHASGLGNSNASGRNANGTSTGNKRRGGGAGANNNSSNSNNNNNRVSTPLSNDFPSHNPNSSLSASHRGNGLSSSHHPSTSSNLAGYVNGSGGGAGGGGGGGVLANGNGGHYYNGTGAGGDHTHSVSGTPDLNIPSNQLLAGPGMVPGFARSASVHSNVTNANGTSGGGRNGNTVNSAGGGGTDAGSGEAGDMDGDNDDNRTYCYCDGVSYGEMIACDDENCEREWFHLSCIGLTVCPEGSWFCDTCKNKRNTKRTGRGGKRRAAGTRAGKA